MLGRQFHGTHNSSIRLSVPFVTLGFVPYVHVAQGERAPPAENFGAARVLAVPRQLRPWQVSAVVAALSLRAHRPGSFGLDPFPL